jgi:hypothetical protein
MNLPAGGVQPIAKIDLLKRDIVNQLAENTHVD